MIWLAVAITLCLVGMALITIYHAFRFPRLGTERPATTPLVSVLIPARNEAATIAATIGALRAQTYQHFELLILDDHSTDQTAAVIEAAIHGDRRCRLLTGAELPAGWIGKAWACEQLAEQATGDYLLFTDADVRWQPPALASVVAAAQQTNADLLTVWPTQITITPAERLVVPLMALTIHAYLPIGLVHDPRIVSAAAANGQCLLFRRDAYWRIGSHRAVAGAIVEDVRLAQRIKAAGLRLRMVEAAGLIQTRMYENWAAVRAGFAKNILAGHANSPFLLTLSSFFHLMIFVWPWLWLVAGWQPGWPFWPLILILFGIGIRAATAAQSDQRRGDAIGMPISTLLMTIIAGQALWWHWRDGGPRWKGRVIKQSATEDA